MSNLKTESHPEIAGKIAIITGASSGIGQMTALEFARAGAKTVLAARRVERLEQLAEEIRAFGGTALVVPTDLTDVSQIRNLVQQTVSAFGRIDVLANIAGWALYDWLEELSAEDLRKHFEVNVIGLAELTRQVVPIMKKQRSGYILNMSSYASRLAIPPLTVYASTKYAVEGLTDGLRRELLPWGIKVIRIHPSSVKDTEFNQRVVREGGIKYRAVPVGRVSRESLARKIVGLVERPRHSLFYSRIYEPGVWLNRISPATVDWIMAKWVRRNRGSEVPPSDQVAPVRYQRSISLWSLAGGILAFSIVSTLLKKKS